MRNLLWFNLGAGVIIALLAFFDFPLPASIDRWFLGIVGAAIAISSFKLMSGESKSSPHEENPAP